MSETPVGEMEAGRELDALVAERVMGWQVTHRGRRVKRADGMEIGGFTGMADARQFIADMCPRYSTDIAAAWQVVERLRSLGWDIGIEDFRNQTATADCWRVDLHRDDDESVEDAFAETVPLAVCRAAILATAGEAHGESIPSTPTGPRAPGE